MADKLQKYPLAPREEWYGEANYQETGGRLVEMTPDEFLTRVRPLKIDEISRDNIDDLKSHMESGRTLDPLQIYKEGIEDGRHRAHAARELGIEKVPVLTWDIPDEPRPTDQPNLPALLGPPEEPRPKGKLRRGIGSLRRAPWFALAQMAWPSFSPEQRKAAEDYAKQAYGSLEAGVEAAQAWTGRRDFPKGGAGGLEWVKDLLGFDDQKPSGIITLPEKMYRDFYHGTPNEWSSEEGYPVGRPRLDFMSTGEGTQMYAPGFYGGEARAVGYEYADRLAQEHGTVPNVYKGEIREDLLNNKFIDFNLPVNEQSQDVQEVFKKLGYETKTPDRFAGADILFRMTRRMGKDAAIDTLREEGIVGLRYLDKFSRDNKNLYKGKSLVKMDGKALFLNEDWQLQGRQVLRYLVDNNMDMGEFIREQREFYGQKGRISRALGGARQQEKFLDILERTVVKKSPLTRNMVIWDQPLLDQIGRTIKKEMAAGGFIDKPLYDNLIAPSRGSFIDKPLYEGAY